MPTATLLISCPDQPGIVAAVAGFVAEHHGNIIHADQHTDRTESVFLQRVEWEMDGFGLDRDDIAEAFDPIAERFSMEWRLRFSDERPRIGVLVSTTGHCLYDLLARQEMLELRGDIVVVASNHDVLGPGVERHGVPFHHLPINGDRDVQEAKLLDLLDDYDVDLVVLARYMQILSPAAVERFRMINIHHSFLPAFAGARPYHQAHVRGVKVIGATAHYVTAELDQGPIIEQDVVRVSHRDDVTDLVRKGRDLEKVVLARAVNLHLEDRVLVYGDKTVVFD